MSDESDVPQWVGWVVIVIVGYLMRRCFSNGDADGRTVLVPVDQLNKIASDQDRNQLSNIETLAVSNVSANFLAVEANLVKSTWRRQVLASLVVLGVAAFTSLFCSSYFNEPNFYHVLETGRAGSTADIKRAYRGMALKMHPDKVSEEMKPAAEKRFILIKEAFDGLGKSKTRTVYERHGKGGKECQADKSSICNVSGQGNMGYFCLLYTSPSPRDS
eukprot:TRINITY_DN62041_c0_g1_i2.p1 TRINITY_DN62041_c0_g1~~TRINITY_DN62041_c0_g1_i2.p1  ORF type:complete len:217 (-),score=56.00 TRINITY_DN62041_c0_g1_i2:83-733(-)